MTNNGVVVSPMSPDDRAEWDNYVNRHPEGTFFHLSGWKNVLEKSFGHKTIFLMARLDDAIVGVLPLGNIKSFLFGTSLASVPFCVYGGVIADSEEIAQLLEKQACELARKMQVDYLEFRNLHKARGDLPVKELYVTFRKEMDPDPEVNMNNIPRKQRAMVRKGISAGLEARWNDDLDTFFDIYAISVKAHGTPVFPKRFFSELMKTFGSQCRVLNVYLENVPVSSVMIFYFRDEVLPYYGGGTAEARNSKAFDFMYWEVMKDACTNGIRIFDYGRSKVGTGSYSFKKNWGFQPQPLYYQYYLVRSDRIPEVNPLNPKYQMFIKAWRKMPLFMTKVLGPLISRSLG